MTVAMLAKRVQEGDLFHAHWYLAKVAEDDIFGADALVTVVIAALDQVAPDT